jgi:hypothetical protein
MARFSALTKKTAEPPERRQQLEGTEVTSAAPLPLGELQMTVGQPYHDGIRGLRFRIPRHQADRAVQAKPAVLERYIRGIVFLHASRNPRSVSMKAMRILVAILVAVGVTASVPAASAKKHHHKSHSTS